MTNLLNLRLTQLNTLQLTVHHLVLIFRTSVPSNGSFLKYRLYYGQVGGSPKHQDVPSGSTSDREMSLNPRRE